MINNYQKDIEEIPYPEEFRDSLQRITPLLIESMERDGLPIESGIIRLLKVDEQMKLPLLFFDWIADSNEVVDNLNIVLSDLQKLPKQYTLLPGPPRIRFYLLIRTYFYEFYRFKEIFNKAIKGFQRGGYIEKTETLNIRDVFYKTFEHTLELRNIFVHGNPIWKGKRHFDLALIGEAYDLGGEIRDKQTGEVRDIASVLKDNCEHMADILKDEGNRMSLALQEAVKYLLEIASKASQTTKDRH